MSTEMQRDQGAALWQQGAECFAKQQWDAARDAYVALLALRPGHPQTQLQLSYVESYRGRYRSARDYALKALEGGIKRPELLANLISRLRTFAEPEAIDEALKRLPPLSHIPIPLLLEFAAQLSYLNQQERTLAFLDEAMRADPSFPPTLMAYGQILTYLGRFDEAEAKFERCIALAPGMAQAHWFLSRLRKQVPSSNHVDRLRKQLLRPAHGPEDPALLQYALHKELDDLKDHSAAWEALVAACNAKRALMDYRPEDSRGLVDKLIAWSAKPSPTSKPSAGTAPETTHPGSHVPIFIVGMHRSGTSLLEQMLAGHDDVHGVGELYDFTAQMRYATDWHCIGPIDATIVDRASNADFAAVGAGYLQKMGWRLGKEKFFTDKLPSNFLNAGFICEALPQAKILHMVRDPVETCFSNLRELFSNVNAYSYDQLELADFYHQYRRLMAHWHRVYPDRILDVDYSQLTRDPEATIAKVAAFCGLDFQPGMLDVAGSKRGVATASAIQVREGIVARARPKWAPYEAQLQPMIKALATSG